MCSRPARYRGTHYWGLFFSNNKLHWTAYDHARIWPVASAKFSALIIITMAYYKHYRRHYLRH